MVTLFPSTILDKLTRKVLHEGTNFHGLYHFLPLAASAHHVDSPQAHFRPSQSAAFTAASTASSSLWHHGLGHPSPLKLHHLTHHLGIKLSKQQCLDCIDCSVAKSHRLPFHLFNSTVNKPLSLIHSDVWGPFESSSSFKYYVLFVDDFSRFTWLYPLNYKSEVYSKFLEFKAYAEKQFSTERFLELMVEKNL